jgi:hypothetical protein
VVVAFAIGVGLSLALTKVLSCVLKEPLLLGAYGVGLGQAVVRAGKGGGFGSKVCCLGRAGSSDCESGGGSNRGC